MYYTNRDFMEVKAGLPDIVKIGKKCYFKGIKK